jgi:hypothetical protein
MTVPQARLVALSAALLIPHVADAQLASRVEAGGLFTDASGQAAIPVSIWRVAPSAGFRGPRGSINIASAAWLQNQNWQLVDGSIGGTLVAPTIYGVRAELIGNASRAFDDRSLGADQIDVGTRISFQFNKKSGAWIGGGVARPWRVVVVSTMDLLNAGAWVDVGNATFTATGTTFSLTKMGTNDGMDDVVPCSSASTAIGLAPSSDASPAVLGDPTACRHRSTVSDITLAGRWNLDRFEFAGEAGHRVGHVSDVSVDSRYWSSGTMTLWVAPRAAIVAGGGRQPSNPARGIPARTFGTLGMMIAYSPARYSVPVTPASTAMISSFDVKSVAEGMQRILVRIARVESVDVMGDFSDWAPLTMVRRGRDLWELTVPIMPGRHQINIRTDGGMWVAPPGLPKANDMFSGEVGILIVKG